MRGLRSVVLAAAVAALLAGCTRDAPPSLPASTRAIAEAPSAAPVPTVALTGTPRTVAALGDSLSRGFDACAQYGDCTAVSWSTGTDPRVDSVAARLSAALRAPVSSVNVARSGATVSDLARQVGLAVQRRPDVVTVLIGANDVCRPSLAAMTSGAAYAATLGTQLHRLATALPHTTVLVASVPDVPELVAVAGHDPTARFLWSHSGACRSVLGDAGSRDPAAVARLASVTARIREYDASLDAICATIPTCVYDGGALFRARFTLPELSPLDSFHPSRAGLRRIAALEWAVLRPRLVDVS